MPKSNPAPELRANRRPFLLALFSGVLLYLAYPPFNQAWLAWFAPAVLFFAFLRAPDGKGNLFRTGLAAGLVFFVLSMSWLRYVTFFGWIFVTSFLSLFFGLLGLICRRLRRSPYLFFRVSGFALAWTGMELVRSELPIVGLGWNLLAYSQASCLPVLQAANLGGAYGLGFVMAMTGAFLAEGTHAFFSKSEEGGRKLRPAFWGFAAAAVLAAAVFAYGFKELNRPQSPARNVRISVVQGNIPQSVKWEPMARDQIIEIHIKLTQLAALDRPDLILWPEASFPGYFNRDIDTRLIYDWIRELKVPVVVGAPYFETWDTVYNSAYLVDAAGEVTARYDKNYLVPFGEYVPFGPLLKWLEPYARAMGVSSFAAGSGEKIFETGEPPFFFTVLICFEDVFPGLVRRFAGEKAQFLAVMTNDAWFGPTGAPYQHLQASVFRAVENGIPVVRAANTGVSGFISYDGRVLDKVNGKGREIFVAGKKTLDLPLVRKPTLYRQGGWIFVYGAAAALVIMLLKPGPAKRKQGSHGNGEAS